MKQCPFCHTTSIQDYIMVNKWRINKCSNCFLLFTDTESKRLKQKVRFYDKEYINGYRLRESELKKRFLHRLLKIEEYKLGGKLLDIGCSLGFFLQIVEKASKYPWKVTGIEPNNNLLAYAQKVVKGKIIKGQISKLPFKDSTFDCVTCFDVLEHDVRLQQNISEIKRILKKGGIFVIQAPNYRSFMAFLTGNRWDWWVPPDHVLHFSFDFLISFFQNNGFKILEGLTYEEQKDFLLNVKGIARKNYFFKLLFYLCIPFLLILERLSWMFHFGGLTFIIAEKQKI